MPCYKQTQEIPHQYQRTQQIQWQQSESPPLYVNSHSGYGYSNPLQRQERALRDQIVCGQANAQHFPTGPYIVSLDGQNMRDRSLSRLMEKPALEHIINSTNLERNMLSSECISTIDIGESAELSKPLSGILKEPPVNKWRSSELDVDKMLRKFELGKEEKLQIYR